MVQRADINSVLSEIRNLRAQMMQNQRVEQEAHVRGGVDRPRRVDESREVPSFGDMLGQAVNHVNDLQQTASDLRTAYELGDPNVDLTRVMIAAQKSSVSFEALTQVRNRVVRAYEDIMNMPI
ncbi:flagellar hook-basal body complex protein FliE [Marinobacter lutaoensis]|jgi:flagellar hook-basal body complex protein FliE|uniref:Flagellar hook-basal body complex protein FliE n=1 Tax=Marinobacter lutaoensis TaxID=135739 RepID=A0A1V2DX44_9GAMM|nr:flagellar hook-basal body complex protein FliE [Marinobacter lutaoensis]MBI44536.1 flagellar hook-basal body complex protein FliE [Oceanospirillales bacterium]NVD34472.1 flagellar hook-basal body complex protein FliE [Marinobacter lutaoensis]ONF45127.1 flagellar hook-basal body complex protein FliE [Marinobacter lutaoensis]|tara:strand:+ start:242 stop:610 length:369 start_codon:yes stop_codon:yes gene_type:complete